MNVDKTDMKIMKAMWMMEDEQITTTDLAKRVFDVSERYDVQKKDSLIRGRLKKLLRYGLILENRDDDVRHYALNPMHCFFGVKVDNSIVWISIV